ncbi:MAG: peptidoglycan DD-metalloendopeptidase family protein [Hydrogenophilales bacterium]|nr:peptidoglycan DD-metalloendopeptidase family protein [Hydrogenophilales bacterium]
MSTSYTVRRYLCWLLLFLSWPVAAALDDKQDELQSIQRKIERLKEELEQSSEDRSETADSLKHSERRISEVNRGLRELRQKQSRLLAELTRLGGAARSTESEAREQETRLAELLRQRYSQRGDDGTRVLLSGRNPAEIHRRIAYFAYIGRARTALIERHRATLNQLDSLRRDTEARKQDLSSVAREREAQRIALEKEKSVRQGMLDKLSERIRNQRKEIGSLQRDEKRLGKLIEKLRTLAEARKSKKPAQAKTGERPKAGEKVKSVADASLAGLEFTKLRGKLAFPVAGEIIARYGQSRDSGGPAWKGLFIRARNGQEVRSVASGEVVFSDWLRGFGNLLIVDHGGGYLSLYSNNESLYKQAGTRVRAGDAVASVGNTGGQEESGLYFELRHLGKPFDPMTWVSAR